MRAACHGQSLERRWWLPLLALAAAGCGTGGSANDGGPDDGAGPGDGAPDGSEAVTVLVAVNPVVNDDAHVNPVPDVLGDRRRGLVVRVGSKRGTTDTGGLVLFEHLEPGDLPVVVEDVRVTTLTDVGAGEVIDVAVAFDGTTGAVFERFPLRYLRDASETFGFGPEDDASAIEDAAATSGAVVVLEPGTEIERLSVRGGATVMAADLGGAPVWIRRLSMGSGARVRGVHTELAAVPGGGRGDDIVLALNTFITSLDLSGSEWTIWGNSLCEGATLAFDRDATVVHNAGLAPAAAPGAETCMP